MGQFPVCQCLSNGIGNGGMCFPSMGFLMGFLWVDDHPGCMVKSIRTCSVKKNKEKKTEKMW